MMEEDSSRPKLQLTSEEKDRLRTLQTTITSVLSKKTTRLFTKVSRDEAEVELKSLLSLVPSGVGSPDQAGARAPATEVHRREGNQVDAHADCRQDKHFVTCFHAALGAERLLGQKEDGSKVIVMTKWTPSDLEVTDVLREWLESTFGKRPM